MHTGELLSRKRGWPLSWPFTATQVHCPPPRGGRRTCNPPTSPPPGGGRGPEVSGLDTHSGHCHAQGHLWVSQSASAFPQHPSQRVPVPGRKKMPLLSLLQRSVPAPGRRLKALTCARLPLNVGAGPAAPSEAFVNSGSLAYFQASINTPVPPQWGRNEHSLSTCFKPGAFTRRTLCDPQSQRATKVLISSFV